MWNLIRPAVVSFIALTVVTGVAYPAIVTAIAYTLFPQQATGCVVTIGDRAVGSALIAQPFTDAKYFWPRPSAANYDASAGSGSNLGPTNPAIVDAVKPRLAALHAAGGANVVPVDLVTASGSGLDPHVSVAAAKYQAERVAKARNLPTAEVDRLIEESTDRATLGVLGDARVNVLALNLRLDHGDAPLVGIAGLRAHGFIPTK